jgi:hypothetical protein
MPCPVPDRVKGGLPVPLKFIYSEKGKKRMKKNLLIFNVVA